MFPINHDLHCHTFLSSCSEDENQTPQAMMAHAERCGYDVIAITDHTWDADVPGASGWYRPQDIAHGRQALPLPKSDRVKFLFGCETEFIGGKTLAMTREHMDLYDIVLIPTNHFHMRGFCSPSESLSLAGYHALQYARLRDALDLDLPWKKIGLAHLFSYIPEGNGDSAFRNTYLALEGAYFELFKRMAEIGVGVELNASDLPKKRLPYIIKIYGAMKAAGCRFYCGSDAHSVPAMDNIGQNLPEIVGALGLEASDRWLPQGV